MVSWRQFKKPSVLNRTKTGQILGAWQVLSPVVAAFYSLAQAKTGYCRLNPLRVRGELGEQLDDTFEQLRSLAECGWLQFLLAEGEEIFQFSGVPKVTAGY